MKRKIFGFLIVLFCLAASLFGFSACGLVGGNPEVGVTPSDFGVFAGDDFIGITGYSYEDGYNRKTEFKLGDGEWIVAEKLDSDGYYVRFDNLEEGAYAVSARQCENGSVLPSNPLTKQITIEVKVIKTDREDVPDVTLKMEGKKCTVVGYTDEMEVWFGLSSNDYIGQNNYTYEEIGYYTVRVRFKETATQNASPDKELTAYANIFSGGTGAQDDPLIIDTYEQFAVINSQKYLASTFNVTYFKLGSDINYPSTAQQPVERGDYSMSLDGNGKKIIGAKIVSSSTWGIGIFARINSVSNLTVENAEIAYETQDWNYTVRIGLIAGNIDGKISNCKASGTVNIVVQDGLDLGEVSEEDTIYVGGLVPFCNDIDGSSADLKIVLPSAVRSNFTYGLVAGGLAASSSNDKITNCSANLTITGEEEADGVLFYANAGGLLGRTDNTEIENCHAFVSADISVRPGLERIRKEITQIGGLVGKGDNASFKSCYAVYNISLDVAENFSANVCGVASGYEDYANGKKENVKNAENTFAQGITDFSGSGHVEFDAFALGVSGSLSNCYHESGATTVQTEGISAVSTADLRDINWQKANLGFNGEVWEFHDYHFESGKFYPTLK